MKNKKIYSFLSDQSYVQSFAQEILEAFKTKACKENIDFSFDIAQGTGKIKSRNSNTTFSFDTNKDSLLHQFKKALYNEDLSDIKENSEEEKQLTNDVALFLRKVSDHIIANNIAALRKVLRNIVLKGSKKQDIPLLEIFILAIDVADYDAFPEPTKYLLSIGKISQEASIKTDKIVQFIHNTQEETGQTAEEVFDEAKKNKNPLFDKVTVVKSSKKYLYDITVTLFVDYSLSHMPPNPVGLNMN